MTVRTRSLLVFTIAIVAAVGLVELLVLSNTREAFERAEMQRVEALVSPRVKGGPGITPLGEWRFESLWIERP